MLLARLESRGHPSSAQSRNIWPPEGTSDVGNQEANIF